jgi:uncharacterized protein YcfJ
MKTIVLALFVLASLAQAERFEYYDSDRKNHKVRVQESTPITKPYTKKIKVSEQCYEDTVEVRVACQDRDTNSIGIDTLIGAGLGIALGNQIGKGSGRDVARAGGGVLGAVIANQTRDSRGNCTTYETVTRCTPVYEYVTEHKTVGYNNCAYIDGQKYCKRTKRPIKWLRFKKSITVY